MSWLNTPNSLPADASDLDTDYYTDAPLPSPANTPYRTPALSRKSSYQHESARPPTSPPLGTLPHHPHRASLSPHDPSMDESISLLDPRRFTPTLHANLVAEILSLRRELESKSQFIDSLEHDLAVARNEQENATTSVATAQREAREVKRKLAAAENDTSVENIVQERDEAVETIGELRRQVERLTKRGRIAEDEVERTRRLAERDAEKWAEMKRALEKRAHIAEGRLRKVLEEIAAQEQKAQEDPASQSETERSETGSVSKTVSDAASIRTISRTGYRPQSFMAGDDVAERFGVRFSHLGFGQSLADELDLREEDEEETEYEEDLVEEDVEGQDDGVGIDDEEDDAEAAEYESDMEETEGMLTPMQLERVPVVTAEVAIQTEEDFPQPQSPIKIIDPQQQLELAEKEQKLANALGRIAELERTFEAKAEEVADWEKKAAELENILRLKDEKITEAQNDLVVKEKKLAEQDIKLEELTETAKAAQKPIMVETGVQTTQDKSQDVTEKQAIDTLVKTYVSASAQTLPLPETLQKTYSSVGIQVTPPPPPPTVPLPPPKLLVSTGVQADRAPTSPTLNRGPIPPPLPRVIPTIQIIPPPPTPPLAPAPKVFVDASSQTSASTTRTFAVQTDAVKIDSDKSTRAPLTLLPSALLNSDVPLALPDTGPAPSLPRRSSKRVTRKDPAPTTPPAASTDGPLVEDPLEEDDVGATPPPIGKGKGKARDSFASLRPIRTSSLFPAPTMDFLGSSDDESLNFSDNEYKTVLSAPKPRKYRYSKLSGLPERSNSKQGANARKSALIAAGSQAHASSSIARSPPTKEAIGPPFPVPIRFSSRKVTPIGSQKTSPMPLSRHGPGRSISRDRRNPSLRKSRSAITLSSTREAPPSPPPLSASTVPPESPMVPPLPRDEVRPPAFPTKTYRTNFGQYKNQTQQPQTQQSSQVSLSTDITVNTTFAGNAVVETVVPQTSVVDAIAQTMVGEWMWKYVRRRKSFGVSDSPPGWDGKDESVGGGQRHKRWVWLAPYERAIMWSSRQPTSGSALLGKSGRKLPIQSVLDVKDDTPLPRGMSPTPIFNRSILILTPARALKFTAPSKERHYVWLTALSFLSHSAQEADGFLSLPPPTSFEYEQVEQQQAHVAPTRMVTERDAFPPPIRPRDSIRIAKKKLDNSSQSSGLHIRKPARGKDHAREDSIAEPPSIPRYPGQHIRRRSNTGSRPPQNRSFTAPFTGNSPYNGSLTTADTFYNSGPVGGIGLISSNTSIANSSGIGIGIVGGWDTSVGTVRMEAFVDSKKARSEADDDSIYNVPNSHQRRDRQKKEQQWNLPRANNFYMGGDDFFRSNDPFRGF